MTTTRQKVLMLAAILGLSAWCSYELLEGWLWNGLVFGLLAVSCAAMFVVQVGQGSGGRRWAGWSLRGLSPVDGYIPYRRVVLASIRVGVKRGRWTWRVKR